MKTLSQLCKKDPRIKKVYAWAKKKYDKIDLAQHNFEHVLRDLYRSLIIADTEKGVNYSILVPAVLLHDIGATVGSYKDHVKNGIKIAGNILPKFSYNPMEIKKILHCIESHGKQPYDQIPPKTIEAKILSDSDLLEKSSIASVFCTYRVQYEVKKPLLEHIKERIKKYESRDERFYTKKASQIDRGGLAERMKHIYAVLNCLKRRKDFLVTEKDLW